MLRRHKMPGPDGTALQRGLRSPLTRGRSLFPHLFFTLCKFPICLYPLSDSGRGWGLPQRLRCEPERRRRGDHAHWAPALSSAALAALPVGRHLRASAVGI